MKLTPFKKHRTLDTPDYNMLVSRDVKNDLENEETSYQIEVTVSFEVVDEETEVSMYMDSTSFLDYEDEDLRDQHFDLIVNDDLDSLRDLDQLAKRAIESSKQTIKNM